MAEHTWQLKTAALSEAERAKLLAEKLARQKSGISLLLYARDDLQSVPLFEQEGVIIGRDAPADVTIDDESLSRQHAHVELIDGAVWIQDLDSTNGTWIGGRRIERAQAAPGVQVVFGTVAAAVHVVSPGRELVLESHDHLLAELDSEVARARLFRRPLALLMLRSRAGEHAGLWLDACRARLRPFDRLALYSPDTLELVLVETDATAGRDLAAELAAGDVPLYAGLAVLPEHAGSAGELVDVTRSALLDATDAEPIRLPAPAAHNPTAPREGPVVIDETMRRLFETAERVASSTLPVLIVGGTGTGKEVLARTVHDRGRRRDGPMVCVNCGAIPTALVESTLFGHEKGAFTGAIRQARGVFESARSGTVFLDEIGELPPAAQSSLLRVLETKRFSRVGSTAEIEADVRIVAATHQNLEAMVSAGTFRQDLLFRLNAMTLEIPPLRERPAEIEPLALRFVHEANRANRSQVRRIAADALELLRHYSWPGNVRELRNAIERAVVIARSDAIQVEDLPERVRDLGAIAAPSPAGPPADLSGLGGPINLKAELNRYEAGLVTRALRQASWNRSAAAELLGIPLRTLTHKIGVHDIKKE